MYRISIPAMAISQAFDCGRVIEDAKKAGATRIVLAIDTLSTNSEIMDRCYTILRSAIFKIHEAGLEAAVWFWALQVMENEPFTRLTDRLGDKCRRSRRCCPLDEDFLQFMEAHIKTITAMHPDLILFDDDLTFENYTYESIGCFCKLHRARMSEILEEPIMDTEELYGKMFTGKPNKYRDAFLRTNGDGLKQFAIRMRRAVDSVDPTVRMGQCGCVTTFDQDGVDSFTLSKLFAGSTKPFLRLIGAPYWEFSRLHGNRLIDVIETERLERSWYPGNDMEILVEGDTYPRPRHRVPAAHLELFDAALRADGSFDGIMKYMLDYYSHVDFERGYLDRHLKNKRDLDNIHAQFAALPCVGVRVYETMLKTSNFDYTHCLPENDVVRHQLFSRAARLLSHNSIPTTYSGSGCAGIAFGENARYLPASAFEKPMIIDIPAARILQEKGIDTGIVSFGKRFVSKQEQFPDMHVTICKHGGARPYAYDAVLSPNAHTQSYWLKGDTTLSAASYTYTNDNGHHFLVFCADCFDWDVDFYDNYARQDQLQVFLKENGTDLPVVCKGNPELYILCKQDEKKLVIGFFNCFADSVEPLTAQLNSRYTKAEFFRNNGYVEENILHIDKLPAFEWCYVVLER